jgi:2-oxoglutarate ferredoxin oxidoreductase subunit delta
MSNHKENKNKKHLICERRCKSCGLCVDACPKDVLAIGSKLNKDGYAVVEQVNPEACVLCGICRIVCPDVAIGVVECQTTKSVVD